MRLQKAWIGGGLILAVLLVAGCQHSMMNDFLDPSEVGRFSGPNMPQNIQGVLSIMDEPLEFEEATEPSPEDLRVIPRDYVIGPGDTVDISIFELLAEGMESVFRRQVSETGYVTIPILGSVKIAGLTARQAEEHLADLLSPDILREPRVSVLVVEQRHQTYDMLGGFGAPGTYAIPRPDFRLLDAIAMARDVQPGVETIYVIRSYNEQQAEASQQQPGASAEQSGKSPAAAQAKAPTVEELQEVVAPSGSAPGGQQGEVALPRLIYVDGKWVEMPTGTTSQPAGAASATEPAEWAKALKGEVKRRVIKIPVRDLLRGDARYNIVIRPGDKVYAWMGPVGEFYVMGHVMRPGVYSLTGRKITLRQAIAAAGGLDPFAWPSRCELIRRHSDEQQEIIQLDLDAIFAGTQPDVVLKPNDVINVGTHPVAPFMATIRNAFRMTYGFGFVYDRNFADIDSFEPQTNPRDRRRAERAARFGGLFR